MNKKTTTKKSTKSTFTVDITGCDTINETAVAFALAKHNAGIPLTDKNLMAIVNATIDMVLAQVPFAIIITRDCACETEEQPAVKDPWYKRFWNKLKYAFTW